MINYRKLSNEVLLAYLDHYTDQLKKQTINAHAREAVETNYHHTLMEVRRRLLRLK